MVCYGIFWSGQLPFDTQMKTALFKFNNPITEAQICTRKQNPEAFWS